MSSYNRLTYLGTSGDLTVGNGKVSGDPIFTGNSVNPYNVLAGELVVFDARANEFLEDSDIATARHISVAVGIGKKGTVAKELRYLGGETFDLCNFEMVAEAAAPVCAQPQILYVFYDGTTCENAATLVFYLDDHLVRDRYNFNEKAKYIFTADPACTDCNTCTPTDNCPSVTDSFVDQINGKVQDNPFILTRFQNRDISHQYQPFRALKLFNKDASFKTFCLSMEDGACTNCAFLSGITGISIDGEETEFTHTTVANGEDLQTLPSQVEIVIDQINAALGDNGAAFKSKGIGSCCDYSITLSVDTDVVGTITLLTDDGEVSPCEEVNPFDVTDKTCGFAVLVDPVTIECICALPPDDVPNYYGRTLGVEFVGDGWGCNSTEVVEKQPQVLPEGFGYFWQDLERYQHNGGSGRDFRNSDRYRGKTILRQDKYSRSIASPVTIDCETSYCMYSLVTIARNINRPGFGSALAHYNADGDWVLIPEGDDNTKTSWELYLNAMYERGICNAPNVTCTSAVDAAQSVTVLPSTGEIDDDGGTLQLTASVYPLGASQAGTWSSSSPSIATVSSGGLVTAVANGSTTITFTSTDGSFTDTSVITVTGQS